MGKWHINFFSNGCVWWEKTNHLEIYNTFDTLNALQVKIYNNNLFAKKNAISIVYLANDFRQ